MPLTKLDTLWQGEDAQHRARQAAERRELLAGPLGQPVPAAARLELDVLASAGDHLRWRRTLLRLAPEHPAFTLLLALGQGDADAAAALWPAARPLLEPTARAAAGAILRSLTLRSPPRPLPAGPEATSSPPSLRFDGPFFGPSGYARAGRGLVAAAEAVGLLVQARHLVWDEAWAQRLPPADAAAWVRRHHQPVDADHHLILGVPTSATGIDQYARLHALAPGFRRRLGMTMFETDRIPRSWLEPLRRLDAIWVPSTQNQHAFRQALGPSAPAVEVLPLPVDARDYEGLPRPAVFTRHRHWFLAIGEWTWRKGWDLLLPAWGRAFPPEADVGLLIHIYDRRGRDLQREADRLLSAHGLDRLTIAPLVVSDRPLPDADVRALLAHCDTYVLPSRGEGLGLPFLEAAAAGRSVIAPGAGSATDFLAPDSAWLLPATWADLPPHAREEWVYPASEMAGHRALAPDPDALVEALRAVVAQPAEARVRADRAAQRVRTDFSSAAVGSRLLRLLRSFG